jgi:hypothetical protein
MATTVHSFAVTVPTGYPSSAPYTQTLTMPPGEVNRVEFTVPDGPRGNVGFALGHGGTQVLPYEAGAWFIWNSQDQGYDLERQVNAGVWTFFGYNTGQYSHLIQVRFLCDPVVSPSSGRVRPFLHPRHLHYRELQL